MASFLVVAKARRTGEDKEIDEEEAEADLTRYFSWCATPAAGSTAVTRAHN